MSPQPDHKPITEAELKEMESRIAGIGEGLRSIEQDHAATACDSGLRLIAEVRRLRAEREEQCDWPGCDAMMPHHKCLHPHRHFKDGHWLDDGSKM